MNTNETELLINLICHGREERNLEYKSSMPWLDVSRAKLTRAILSMSNLRDGGNIVVGVNEKNDCQREGVPEDCLETYTQDIVSDYVNNFAKPNVDLTVRKVTYEGKKLCDCYRSTQ